MCAPTCAPWFTTGLLEKLSWAPRSGPYKGYSGGWELEETRFLLPDTLPHSGTLALSPCLRQWAHVVSKDDQVRDAKPSASPPKIPTARTPLKEGKSGKFGAPESRGSNLALADKSFPQRFSCISGRCFPRTDTNCPTPLGSVCLLKKAPLPQIPTYGLEASRGNRGLFI